MARLGRNHVPGLGTHGSPHGRHVGESGERGGVDGGGGQRDMGCLPDQLALQVTEGLKRRERERRERERGRGEGAGSRTWHVAVGGKEEEAGQVGVRWEVGRGGESARERERPVFLKSSLSRLV
jgi:hypothetical protein